MTEKYWGKKQRRGRSGLIDYTPRCRTCKNELARLHRAKQPTAKLAAIQRRNRQNRIEKYGLESEKRRNKRIRILRKYGLTLEQYEDLLSSQRGVCKICNAPAVEQTNGVLAVDHDHETGEVRGLLCTRCNSGLAMFEDKASLLRDAADYLESYAA